MNDELADNSSRGCIFGITPEYPTHHTVLGLGLGLGLGLELGLVLGLGLGLGIRVRD